MKEETNRLLIDLIKASLIALIFFYLGVTYLSYRGGLSIMGLCSTSTTLFCYGGQDEKEIS